MNYNFVGEDEHTFTVRHPDGSDFIIAKQAVGPGVHKRIKELEPVKMADGGEVSEIKSPDKLKDSDYKLKTPDFVPEDQSELGKGLRNFLGLGYLDQPKTAPQNPDEILKPNQNLASPMASTTPQMASTMPDNSPQNYPQPGLIERAPSAMPQQQPQIPQQPQTAMQQTILPTTPSDAYAQAFAQKESGIQGIAKAQEQAGQAQAEAYKEQANQIAQTQAHYEQEHAKLDAEHKQLTDAVLNEKIDPNRLYHNMGTGNKILAAISVALSGIGAGLQGGNAPNMAMGVIQKSIDRDIEAQRMELGKKQTLLSENVRKYGDLHTATQMTQLQLNAITQAKVAQAAAQSGSAQAQQQAKMMLGDLGLQAAQIKQQAAIRQMAMQGGNYDPSVFVSRIVPENHQKAVFDEIQRAQDTRRMGDTILKSFDQAAKENTVLRTSGGLLRTPGSVLALHQSMQPTFKDLEGTVRQAAMDNTFHNITPAPGDADSTIKTKRAALEDYLKSKMSAPTAKGFGIDLDKFGSTTTTRPETKTVNGITYMRGPNGQAIQVK